MTTGYPTQEAADRHRSIFIEGDEVVSGGMKGLVKLVGKTTERHALDASTLSAIGPSIWDFDIYVQHANPVTGRMTKSWWIGSRTKVVSTSHQ